MAKRPAISPSPQSAAPAWVPKHHVSTTLYHGCLRAHATQILNAGVNVFAGRPDTDFGLGFYTTTLRRQAEDWAYFKHKSAPTKLSQIDRQPVVLRFDVPRAALARLETLSFVRGDYHADEFWSFVHHCRASVPAARGRPAVIRHHDRIAGGQPTWYDLVCGPVAAFWQQRSAMLDADQFSFHTVAAQNVLNDVLAGQRGHDYDLLNVTVIP